eukprot:2026838-Heterocapsa_arctica.AAC.1
MLQYIKGSMYAELYVKVNEDKEKAIRVMTDAKWVAPIDGCSTTGRSVWWNGFLLSHKSKTQSTVA